MANAITYGFLTLEGLFDQHISDSNVNEVTTAIAASVTEHNRQMDALLGLFATTTTEFKTRYQQINEATLQPLDQNGRARPVLPTGYYDVAFPIRDAGSAWGANFKARAKMTVGDADRITAFMLNADKTWLRTQLLAALFADSSYTYTDPDHGALTVEPLANGDGVTYSLVNGAPAADTHQYAQSDAIADAHDPFQALHDELTEHPENDGEVVALVPTGLRSAIEGLTGFHRVADPNIAAGISSDRLVGALGVAVPGELIGYHDAGVWIVDWGRLPANYGVVCMTQGPRALAMRQEPQPALQGFIQVDDERNDHPFYERQWVRFAGFGGWNRTAAVAFRIGNATYDDPPTGYKPPIW